MHSPDIVVTGFPRRAAQLRLPAAIDELPVARGVATVLATAADFTLDEISDITLATDEVCSRLISAAAVDAEISLDFEAAADFRLEASVRTRPGYSPDVDSFGWHVLVTLTDQVTVVEPETERDPTVIGFRKIRDVDR